jgi:hypothetical protein
MFPMFKHANLNFKLKDLSEKYRMKTILICGSRDWKSYNTIATQLNSLQAGDTIVHGNCRGADRIAGELAKERGLVVKQYPANWNKNGQAAGPIRNSLMLKDNPDIAEVWCFHDSFVTSRGSRDMVKKAEKKGIPIKYYTSS